MRKLKKNSNLLITGIFMTTLGTFTFSDAVAVSIYFAGDMPPTTSERSPESSLCYRFKVDSLEMQLTKLKRKYSDSLLAAGIDVTSEGARVLTAHRFDAAGRRIDYFYSDRPEVCDAYQQRRGVLVSPQSTPEPLTAKPDPVPDSAVLEQSLTLHFPALAEQVKAGDAEAQYSVGSAYATGTGVDKDLVAAAYWYRKAAEQGHPGAQNDLGYAYRYGLGVAQSEIEAVKWYRLAAEQGYAMAQYNLGVMYDIGKGVPKDDIEAVKWYRLAAEQGDANAQNNLGWMYENGQGVPQDYREAVKWYRLAAEQGTAMSQSNLGLMYENGRGVPQDWAIAYALYNLAAAHDNERAISNREQLIGKLTSRQIEEGQKISRLWKPGTPLPLQSETGAAPEPSPASTAPKTPEVSSTGDCRPTGTAIRCQSRCINGDCIVTYENGCKIRVQVRPSFNSFNNQWEYPSPSC